jgi:hypothetical protein
MGRKLAEATKACRIRRTRGEIVLGFRVLTGWRFTAPGVGVAGFFPAGACVVGPLLLSVALLLLAAP